jgi:hypothetical protein
MTARDAHQFAIPQTFESVNDAAREVVSALGGTKQVGPKLWPGKEQGEAQRHLNDCLNSDRPQKLSPEELLTLARWGRDIGCHSLAVYMMERAGYARPVPISPGDEKAELERAAMEAVKAFRSLVDRYELVANSARPK